MAGNKWRVSGNNCMCIRMCSWVQMPTEPRGIEFLMAVVIGPCEQLSMNAPAPLMSVVLGFNFCHENLAFEYCRKGMALEETWQQLSHTCGLGPVPASFWWARTRGMIEAVSLLTLRLGTWHYAGIYRNIWWGANSVPVLKTWQLGKCNSQGWILSRKWATWTLT